MEKLLGISMLRSRSFRFFWMISMMVSSSFVFCTSDELETGEQCAKEPLCEYKKDSSSSDTKGLATPSCLFQEVIKGAVESVQSLIDQGVPLETKDKHGNTCLVYAVIKGNRGVAQRLLDQGAEVDTQESVLGTTPLFRAVLKNDIPMAQLLLDNKATINAQDKHGMTCLFHAVMRKNNKRMVQFLLENGANIHAQDKEGATCLFYAALCGNKKMVEFLCSQGAHVQGSDHAEDSSIDVLRELTAMSKMSKQDRALFLEQHGFDSSVSKEHNETFVSFLEGLVTQSKRAISLLIKK